MITWLLILALVTIYVYVEWLPGDIDQSILKHQASLPPVRSPGESGVYRSTDTPHSTPLLCHILGKHFFEFTIAKLWEPESFHIEVIEKIGKTRRIINFADHVHRLGTYLVQKRAHTVVVALPVGIETLTMTFACGLYNIDIVFAEVEDAKQAQVAANADMVVSSPLSVDNIEAMPTPVPEPRTVSYYSTENGLRTFTAREIGLSIASQLRSLGHRMWNREDKVLIFPTCNHPYTLLMQLTALSSKSQLIFVSHSSCDPFELIESSQATVLVTDDVALSSLQRHIDEMTTWKLARVGWARMILQRGRLGKPLYPEFQRLRLIHSANAAGVVLSSAQANDIRILTGTQLIHAFRVPPLFMPLFQTSFGDYRVSSGKTSLMGPPTPGIEVKVIGSGNYGELMINFQDSWVDTGAKVRLRNDGCAVVDAQSG